MTNATDEFDRVLDYLPKSIAALLSRVNGKTKGETVEIRLRAGRPLCLTTVDSNLYISDSGEVCHLCGSGMKIVLTEEIFECYRILCDFSIHSHEQEIASGFIALPNGNRAGIVGTAIVSGKGITGFKAISSINIRISREKPGFAQPYVQYFGNGGTLIAGCPGSGKTTFLRDAVRIVSDGCSTEPKRISLIDSRCEIAGVLNGIPIYDVGRLTDVMSLAPKADGTELAIRSMNPQIIAFDEIGRMSEVEAVRDSLFAGVEIITTVHAGSIGEIENRNVTRALLDTGAIRNILFIGPTKFCVTAYSVSNGNITEAVS